MIAVKTADEIEQEIMTDNEGEDFVGMPNGTAIIKTTFWSDFSIAEKFGAREVKDTYRRAFNEWKSNIRYMTALAICLNHKIWETYTKSRALGQLYNDLWQECDKYILDYDYNEETEETKYKNFNSEEITYYVRATD